MSRPLPGYMPIMIGNVASKLILIAGRIGDKGELVPSFKTLRTASDMTGLLMQSLSNNISLNGGGDPMHKLADMVQLLERLMFDLSMVIRELAELGHHDLAAELQDQLDSLRRALKDNAHMLEGKP